MQCHNFNFTFYHCQYKLCCLMRYIRNTWKEKNTSHAILQFVLQDEVYHSSFVKLQRGKTFLYCQTNLIIWVVSLNHKLKFYWGCRACFKYNLLLPVEGNKKNIFKHTRCLLTCEKIVTIVHLHLNNKDLIIYAKLSILYTT